MVRKFNLNEIEFDRKEKGPHTRGPFPALKRLLGRLPATTAAATAATAATRTVLGFVDTQRTTAHVGAIQCLNGTSSVLLRHFNKTEPALAASLAINRKGDRFDRAVLGKQGTNRIFIGGKGQIAHINFCHLWNNSHKQTKQPAKKGIAEAKTTSAAPFKAT